MHSGIDRGALEGYTAECACLYDAVVVIQLACKVFAMLRLSSYFEAACDLQKTGIVPFESSICQLSESLNSLSNKGRVSMLEIELITIQTMQLNNNSKTIYFT